MLVELRIRDYAVVDDLTLSLGSGLNALTGETGAGKSILLDALGVCIGLRASPEMIRRGARQASITAVFDVPDRHPVFHELRELGLQIDDSELVHLICTKATVCALDLLTHLAVADIAAPDGLRRVWAALANAPTESLNSVPNTSSNTLSGLSFRFLVVIIIIFPFCLS